MQPFTSIFICWGFLFGCIITVFLFKTWQFYSSLFFLTILFPYFKPFRPVLLGFIFAIFVVITQYHLFYSFSIENQQFDDEIYFSGQVVKVFGEEPADYFQVSLSDVGEHSYLPWMNPKANLAISQNELKIKAGSIITGMAKIRPFRGRKNFSGFDSELYAFRNQIAYKGRVLEATIAAQQNDAYYEPYRQFSWQVFGGLKLGWLYYTLMTGDTSQISHDTRVMMRRLGLSHIMAISGLHIGIIFGISYWSVKAVVSAYLLLYANPRFQKYNLTTFYMCLSGVIAFIYVYLSGFSVSALRAYSMLLLAITAYIACKKISSMRILVIALSLILLLDPFLLLNPGLYFSFIAVAVIFFVMSSEHTQHSYKMNLLFKVILLIKIQVCLFVFLAPLSIYFFKGVSLAGLFINLLAIPVLSIIVFPFMILALILSFAIGHASWGVCLVLTSLDGCFHFLLKGASMISAGHGWLHTGSSSLSITMFIYLFLLFIVLAPFRKLVWLPAVIYAVHRLSSEEVLWQLDVLDVGHGTAVLISSNREALLYDLGAKYFNRYSLFEHVVQPYIEDNHIVLTHTILSHQDKDHVGGVKELLAFDGIHSFKSFHNGIPNSDCNLRTVKMGEVTIETLWPRAGRASKNNNSCVVKVSGGNYSALLTGDIEAHAERQLVNVLSAEQLENDILLVPHHGSKTSSTMAFLQAVNADIAIYSRNYASQWGLPHTDVRERFTRLGTLQLDTALDGHIRIKVTPDGLITEKAREVMKYWFLPQ